MQGLAKAIEQDQGSTPVVLKEERADISKHDSLLLCRFGHDIAGVGGEAGAFELDGDVVDGEGVMELCADGGEDGFALVHVHIRDTSMTTERIEVAAERPDVHVMHFHDAGYGENRARDLFHF